MVSPSPLRSLQNGHWFKLICGASYQYLPAIEHLTRAYALAGADCIDVSADPAVVAVARSALDSVPYWGDRLGLDPTEMGKPWLMVSFNDGEDPHFRKAHFDPQVCPADCPQPCQKICPAQAIRFDNQWHGIQSDRCYGCGRCLPLCPWGYINTHAYEVSPQHLLPQLLPYGIDALELHTQVGHLETFQVLWRNILPALPHLKAIAISCPFAPGVVDYLRRLHPLLDPLPPHLIWQTDGRPMSGDIGDGTTHATIAFAQELLTSGLPGFVQLAGGTNAYTVPKLRSLNLLGSIGVAGVAYGSYARKELEPLLATCPDDREATYCRWLGEAVTIARKLIQPLKSGVL